ncbi:hypothetical protein BGAL_0095g00280 [Botrytis galanthina]|uniref:SGNH hydrolase-type esterase domain-containing protein n=1 Tax=Botrytis galanthina TaxID=278940 RepID=A0A4S8R565_9HELO|nr:hypothetical protein BGAL_0095g00280 [Botrytis galanthina]
MITDPSPVQPSDAPITASKLSPLRILCLGDSLTEGYSHFGTKFTPYSKWMKEVLVAKWPDRAIEVITDGVSGDLVTPPGGFKRRMERHSFLKVPSNPPITHTILLGGTNDLAYNRPVQTLYAVFETLIFTPLSNSSKVLIITIPECHVRAKVLDEKREELNDMLVYTLGRKDNVLEQLASYDKDEYKTLYANYPQMNSSTFDLRGAMPYHNMELEKRELLWDDGLHFTEEGYKEIGIMVGEKMIQVIEEVKPEKEISLSGRGTMGIE